MVLRSGKVCDIAFNIKVIYHLIFDFFGLTIFRSNIVFPWLNFFSNLCRVTIHRFIFHIMMLLRILMLKIYNKFQFISWSLRVQLAQFLIQLIGNTLLLLTTIYLTFDFRFMGNTARLLFKYFCLRVALLQIILDSA